LLILYDNIIGEIFRENGIPLKGDFRAKVSWILCRCLYGPEQEKDVLFVVKVVQTFEHNAVSIVASA
jgi:hypothetical protein